MENKAFLTEKQGLGKDRDDVARTYQRAHIVPAITKTFDHQVSVKIGPGLN